MEQYKHSPANILWKMIIDLGLASDPSSNNQWPIYIDHLPDMPDNALLVTNTSGISAGREMIGGYLFLFHGLQILARSDGPVDGFIKLSDIVRVLATKTLFLVVLTIEPGTSTITYKVQNVQPTTPVAKLGPEAESRRYMFSANFSMTFTVVS